MITLEQVRQLESRVKRAVELIDKLRGENTFLKDRLEKSERRLKELETLVDGFRNDQDQIEKGIKDILDQLNALEDDIHPEQPQTSSMPEPRSNPAESSSAAPSSVEPPQTEPVEADIPVESTASPLSGNNQEEEPEDIQADQEDEPPDQLDIF